VFARSREYAEYAIVESFRMSKANADWNGWFTSDVAASGIHADAASLSKAQG
jgi:hypothetical protein